MQCQALNNQSLTYPLTESLNFASTTATVENLELSTTKTVHFRTQFAGYMEMYSDSLKVAEYLNAHEGWFCRCAQPMTVEPIGENGYILVVGKFGSFGYEVEPKLAVVLQPPQNGVYLMNSIPIPGYQPPGYAVDYQASMALAEIPAKLAGVGIDKAFQKHGLTQLPTTITKVEWELNLDVAVQFPQFIHKLPPSIIQNTGDRLLAQIVKQISPRLTQKVQQDFHTRLSLPIPPKTSRNLQRIDSFEAQVA